MKMPFDVLIKDLKNLEMDKLGRQIHYLTQDSEWKLALEIFDLLENESAFNQLIIKSFQYLNYWHDFDVVQLKEKEKLTSEECAYLILDTLLPRFFSKASVNDISKVLKELVKVNYKTLLIGHLHNCSDDIMKQVLGELFNDYNFRQFTSVYKEFECITKEYIRSNWLIMAVTQPRAFRYLMELYPSEDFGVNESRSVPGDKVSELQVYFAGGIGYKPSKTNLLCLAALTLDHELVLALLKRGADPNGADSDGNTPALLLTKILNYPRGFNSWEYDSIAYIYRDLELYSDGVNYSSVNTGTASACMRFMQIKRMVSPAEKGGTTYVESISHCDNSNLVREIQELRNLIIEVSKVLVNNSPNDVVAKREIMQLSTHGFFPK